MPSGLTATSMPLFELVQNAAYEMIWGNKYYMHDGLMPLARTENSVCDLVKVSCL